MATPLESVTVAVAPLAAAGSEAAEQRLPLTYFDMIWLYFHPIQRLLFYHHPCSKTHFFETIVPNLQKSLSQTLRHYLPLAGNLIHPLDSGMPELRYVAGDTVPVTFAEASEELDFSYLTGNQARDAGKFHSLVPDLPESRTEYSEPAFRNIPLLAIQVTLFPEKGICIGITNHHVVGDASTIVGFINAWSTIAKLGQNDGVSVAENISLPFYDRSVIRDLSGRANVFWNQMKVFQLGSPGPNPPPANKKTRSTYILQKTDIQNLKNLVSAKAPDLVHLSSFTVTTAYVWSCLARSAAPAGESVGDDEPEYFGFAVDARHRLDPPAPAGYFGNCVAFVVAELTHGRLRDEEEGFVAAAELVGGLIGKKVNRKEELMRDADDWLVKYGPLMGKRVMGVAGSPKFDLYGTEFGWGKPVKYECVSIDAEVNESISLCKSREFDGGLEIGLCLPKKKIEAFETFFYHGLKY
ncbi:hypothetical protein ABFS82_02G152900 [Erythranthe guttata]